MMDIQKKGNIVSLFLTATLWIALAFLSVTLNVFPQKKEYKVIRIQLENPAPVKKTQNSDLALKKQSEKKVEKKYLSQSSEKNTSSVKKSVKNQTKVAEEKQVLQKSVDELMAEMNKSGQKKNTQWDESLFANDDASSLPEKNESSKKVAKVSQSFSGNAASSSSSVNNAASSSSSQAEKKSSAASSSTSSALSSLKNTPFYGNDSDDDLVDSFTQVRAAKENGKTSIEMLDGSVRQMLIPSEPKIVLSKSAASLIDGNPKVRVTFGVRSDGTIASVEITPSSLLPLAVQNEIKTQISSWKFAPGGDGQASFYYTIIKK